MDWQSQCSASAPLARGCRGWCLWVSLAAQPVAAALGCPEPALPQGPAGTFVLQLVEALQPEAPEGSNARARADQNAGRGWLLREVELISSEMQEYLN